MRYVKASAGETLMDIAILHLGSIEGVFLLANLNGLSITDVLESGQVILLNDVIDADVVGSLQQRRARPARGESSTEIELQGGIGFMQIGNDFKVS